MRYVLAGKVRAAAINAKLSLKQTRELCRAISGLTVERAKAYLNSVAGLRQAVPFKRYNWNTGHKSSSAGPGRFPVKAAKEILRLLRAAEANAVQAGLVPKELVVAALAKRGQSLPRPGRRRWRARRCHIELVLQ